MEKIMKVFLVGVFLLASTGVSSIAATSSFTVSAAVPAATGVSIIANSINSASGVATPVTGSAMSFNPLVFDAVNSIYGSDHYFSIAVGTTGGAGTPNVTVNYTEGANPNNPGHGLGWKATATFIKQAATATPIIIAAGSPKVMLKDVVNTSITSTTLSGGSLIVYLGLVSKDPTVDYPDPAASEPFTNGDKPNSYTGTFVVTATLA